MPFADQAADTTGSAELSPDGTQVLVGDGVLDVTTGQQVAQLPISGAQSSRWTEDGIVYWDETPDRYVAWLWNPGSDPVPAEKWMTQLHANGVTIDDQGGCAVARPIDDPQGKISRFCAGSPVSLSPDATWVLTAGYTVADVETGETQRLPMPRFANRYSTGSMDASLGSRWEDDDHLVIVVSGHQPDRENQFSLVRCTISTNTCEQASDTFAGSTPLILPRG